MGARVRSRTRPANSAAALISRYYSASQITKVSDGSLWPHQADVYIPKGKIKFVLVLLHGGSGTSGGVAQQAGVCTTNPPTQATVNWSLLESYGCVVVAPQGQAANGVVGPFNPQGATSNAATWSNETMWSGQDDATYFLNMGVWIKSLWSGAKIIFAGHSNGGMMVQKLWQQQPQLADYFCSACGPFSKARDLSPPATPASIKPFHLRFSLGDTVVGIKNGFAGAGNHWADSDWTQNPILKATSDYYAPNNNLFMGGWRSFAWQVSLNGFTYTDAGNVVTVQPGGGNMNTWTYGNMRMERIDGGAHDLDSQFTVTNTRMFNVWLDWAIALG